MKQLLKDENAQTVTEYILVMAVVVGLVFTLIKVAIEPTLATLKSVLVSRFQSMLFNGDLHSIRIGR